MATGFVIVPQGWQREVMEGRVSYKSPDMKTLKSREELLLHLTSDGTCKCGLRCPFQLEDQFSFDPLVLSLPDNGVPSLLQASCKIRQAQLPQLKPDGAVKSGEKSILEETLSEPKSHQRCGRLRGHRKKHSGKRMPDSKDKTSTASKIIKPAAPDTCESNSMTVAKSGGKNADVQNVESPTKPQDATRLPDVSVRGLLSQLPGSSTPATQQGKQTDKQKLSEKTEDGQLPSSRLLSAVLTRRSIGGELIEKKDEAAAEEGDEGGEGRGRESQGGLTVSIKLGGNEELKDVEENSKNIESKGGGFVGTSDLARSEGEPGNEGMAVLESDPVNSAAMYTECAPSTGDHQLDVVSIPDEPPCAPDQNTSSVDQFTSQVSQQSEVTSMILPHQLHPNHLNSNSSHSISSVTQHSTPSPSSLAPSSTNLGHSQTPNSSSLASFSQPPSSGGTGFSTQTSLLPPVPALGPLPSSYSSFSHSTSADKKSSQISSSISPFDPSSSYPSHAQSSQESTIPSQSSSLPRPDISASRQAGEDGTEHLPSLDHLLSELCASVGLDVDGNVRGGPPLSPGEGPQVIGTAVSRPGKFSLPVQVEVSEDVSEWFPNETQVVESIGDVLTVKQNGTGHLNGDGVTGGGGVALITSTTHIPFSPKLASEIQNGDGDSITIHPHAPVRPPLLDPTFVSNSVEALPPLVSKSEPDALETTDLLTVDKALFSPSGQDIVNDDVSAASGHNAASDSSFPVSDLSSLSPDSRLGHSGSLYHSPPQNLSASVPIPSHLRQGRTPQFGDVPIKECRIELKPIGREWTPRKRHFSECDASQRERELKVAGVKPLTLRIHPKKLKFSVEGENDEDEHVSIDLSDQFHNVQSIVCDAPPSAQHEVVNQEIVQPSPSNPEIAHPSIPSAPPPHHPMSDAPTCTSCNLIGLPESKTADSAQPRNRSIVTRPFPSRRAGSGHETSTPVPSMTSDFAPPLTTTSCPQNITQETSDVSSSEVTTVSSYKFVTEDSESNPSEANLNTTNKRDILQTVSAVSELSTDMEVERQAELNDDQEVLKLSMKEPVHTFEATGEGGEEIKSDVCVVDIIPDQILPPTGSDLQRAEKTDSPRLSPDPPQASQLQSHMEQSQVQLLSPSPGESHAECHTVASVETQTTSSALNSDVSQTTTAEEVDGVFVRSVATSTKRGSESVERGMTEVEDRSCEKALATERGGSQQASLAQKEEEEACSPVEEFGWLHILAQVAAEASPKVNAGTRGDPPSEEDRDLTPPLQATEVGDALQTNVIGVNDLIGDISHVQPTGTVSEDSAMEKRGLVSVRQRRGGRRIRVWGRRVGQKRPTGETNSRRKFGGRGHVSLVASTEESSIVDVMGISENNSNEKRLKSCGNAGAETRADDRGMEGSEGRREKGDLNRGDSELEDECMVEEGSSLTNDVSEDPSPLEGCSDSPSKSAVQGGCGPNNFPADLMSCDPCDGEDMKSCDPCDGEDMKSCDPCDGKDMKSCDPCDDKDVMLCYPSDDTGIKSCDTGKLSGDAGTCKLDAECEVAGPPPEKKAKTSLGRWRGGRRRKGRGRGRGKAGCERRTQAHLSDAETQAMCAGMELGPSGMDSEQSSTEFQTDASVEDKQVKRQDTVSDDSKTDLKELTTMASPLTHGMASSSGSMPSPIHPVPTKHDSFQSQSNTTSSSKSGCVPTHSLSLLVSVPLSKVEVIHYQSFQCYSTSQFQSGDVVWAKAAQLPGWPGIVINHNEWKRNRLKEAPLGKRWVKWFGDDTVSLVSEKSMKPLSEGLKRRMQRKTTKDLQKAISLALKAQRKKEKKQL